MFDRTSTIGLPVILIVFLVILRAGWSPAGFGYTHDDSIYLSSARALAFGEGYVIPSIPGSPPQTKYPIGYPLLLSLVWLFSPEFPANLNLAFWLNALFGCAFLAGSYVLLRQLGAGTRGALAVTGVCAVHPVFLDLAGMLLSDVPFMAFAVWAMVFAGLSLARLEEDKAAFRRFWVAAAAFSALAVMTRSIGVSFVVAIAVAAILRGANWAGGGLFLVGALVFLSGLTWSAAARPVLSGGATPADGYEQTLLFYTSYLEFWKFSVPDWATFRSLLSFNFMEFLKAPAALCFLLPVTGFAPGIWQVIGVALSVGIVKGILSAGTSRDWRTVHLAFAFYAPLVLTWNYTLMDRFLLVFLPVLLWGAAREIGRVLSGVREAFQKTSWGDRIAAGVLLAVVAGLVSYAAYRYVWRVPTLVANGKKQRQALLPAKLEAYSWIREHTAPGDRFIAYEDVTLYLQTRRQALRPIATSTAAFYRQDKSILDTDLARLSDAARALSARYWLVSTDDYHLETADEYLLKATEEILRGCPVAYTGDGLRIFEISTLQFAK